MMLERNLASFCGLLAVLCLQSMALWQLQHQHRCHDGCCAAGNLTLPHLHGICSGHDAAETPAVKAASHAGHCALCEAYLIFASSPAEEGLSPAPHSANRQILSAAESDYRCEEQRIVRWSSRAPPAA